MTTVNIYLLYEGTCRAAFEFYKSVFGGEFESISTFGEMPPQEGQPPMPDDMKEMIMHVTLRINQETLLMGSDNGGETGPPVSLGNNFSIFVHTDSVEETERIFNALSEEGTVNMPLEKTFWNSYFGMLTDQFGVNWMVSMDLGINQG
jgi:PhnB protein